MFDNSIENLEIVTPAQHALLHGKKPRNSEIRKSMLYFKCESCGKVIEDVSEGRFRYNVKQHKEKHGRRGKSRPHE